MLSQLNPHETIPTSWRGCVSVKRGPPESPLQTPLLPDKGKLNYIFENNASIWLYRAFKTNRKCSFQMFYQISSNPTQDIREVDTQCCMNTYQKSGIWALHTTSSRLLAGRLFHRSDNSINLESH